MTTIRKIVTSKIDGDDANNTSTYEVRPFGELAAYINTDNNGGPNKLELLMFDGVRTHLRSKVLSKGTFYGGDADSGTIGFGIENFDTIKLIPDAELHYNDSSYGNDQYIVIDPTGPNHIHVRAGGAIDASNALLILGGELNNVSVSDAADQVEIRTNDTHTWLFGSDGSLTLPANSSILTNETALKIATHSTTTYTFNQAYWEALNGNATRMLTITGNAQYFSCTVTANQDGTYTVADLTGNSFEPGDWFKVPGNELGGATPANDIQINIATVDGDGVILTTTITGTAVGKQWQFGTSGNLTLPGTLTLPQGGTITEGGGLTGAIKLTPAGGANAYQALVIYPTATGDGDHLHLTAGGGTTELYLGNDFHYVKLVDGGNIEVRATHPNTSTAAWTFDTAGNIDAQQALGIKVPNGVPSSVTAITMTTASWELNPLSNLATTGGSGSGLTVTVTETGGYVTAIAIATAGTGYTAGDVITVTSGTSSAAFTIAVAGRNTWQFGEDGKLTLPGNLVIAGNANVFGIDASLIQQTDGLPIVISSSGANGAVATYWVEDYANASTSNIAAVYVRPTVGANIVRIAVGQNGVGSGPNLWDFGTDGNLTLPQTNMNSSPAPTSLPGITWTDGTFQSGRTINVPEDQSMKLEFTSSQYGSGNLQIRNNGIKTSTQSISLETGNNSYFGFEGTYKEITFSESYGSIVFGTQTRNQTGHYNDIEIKSYSDGTNGNVYISAGGSPTNNRWTFKPNGTLVVPGAVQNTNYFEIKAGTVSDNTWNLGIDGSTVFPNNTLKGYCFTATNTVTNYLPQSSQFMYSDSPILGQILSIGGTWYIKGPGLVGWKQITAVQDNSGVALIVRIGSGNTPLGDGSEFPSGGGNVYTISQYLDLDLQVADKTWTFDQAGNLTLPQGSTLKGAGSLTVSNYQPQLGPYTGIVSQSMTGNGYIVVGKNLSDIFAGVNLNSLIGSTLVVAGQNNTVLGVTYLGFSNSRDEYSVQISGPTAGATAGSGVAISITKAETKNDWIFGTDGNLILPANSDIVSSTGVGQLANRVSGTWTVTTGTDNYSFTVPINGAYQLWVRGNIPNGIISYIATVQVTNSNVPVLGTQRAWNYTGGGTPISLTSMPAQIVGAEGTISTATVSGTTNNVFVFGISNTSASTQTVSWGYTRISQ